MVKRTRRFTCKKEECMLQPFGSEKDLDRHYRGKHGIHINGEPAQKFPCPVLNCTRGPKPFSRQKNLEDHMKKIHSGLYSSEAEYSSTRRTYLPEASVIDSDRICTSTRAEPTVVLDPLANMPLVSGSSVAWPEVSNQNDPVAYDEVVYELEMKRQSLYREKEKTVKRSQELDAEVADLDYQIQLRKQGYLSFNW